MSDDIVCCSNCGKTEDVDVAVGSDWAPYYWDETVFPSIERGPLCGVCVALLGVKLDDDCEWFRPGGAA